MHSLLETGTWLGASALYFAFAAAMGAGLRHLRAGRSLLPAAGATAIYLPATVWMLCYDGWPLPARLLPLALGTIALVLSLRRPGAARPCWRRTFALRYLASVMAISALAQAGLAWASASAAALALAAAAALAAWASLQESLQPG